MKLSCMKVILLVLCISAALSVAPAYGLITGSAHDFSGTGGWAGGKICAPCHTPHNAKTEPGAPLWNHEPTTATFTLYSSDTFDAAADVNQPTDSKLCLSCHDGTIGLADFGGTTGGTDYITGTSLIGTNLSDMHPIGFTYDAALASADGELANPTTANSGLGGTITNDMLGGTGNLGCAACHDVHNTPGIAKLLRKSNAASALCLTCHNK